MTALGSLSSDGDMPSEARDFTEGNFGPDPENVETILRVVDLSSCEISYKIAALLDAAAVLIGRQAEERQDADPSPASVMQLGGEWSGYLHYLLAEEHWQRN